MVPPSQVNEYLHWGISAYVGTIEGWKGSIEQEWSIFTRKQLKKKDKKLYKILKVGWPTLSCPHLTALPCRTPRPTGRRARPRTGSTSPRPPAHPAPTVAVSKLRLLLHTKSKNPRARIECDTFCFLPPIFLTSLLLYCVCASLLINYVSEFISYISINKYCKTCSDHCIDRA